jgi:hypothetical protein
MRVRYEVRPLGGRWVEVHHAANHAKFGPRAQRTTGQICMSARRLLVDRRIADAFVDRLAAKTAGLKAGDPFEPDTIIGPLINRRALDMVAGRVEEAVAGGAKVLAGGGRVGRCFPATLLADVPPDSELAGSRPSARWPPSRWSTAPRRRWPGPTTPPTGWPPGS